MIGGAKGMYTLSQDVKIELVWYNSINELRMVL